MPTLAPHAARIIQILALVLAVHGLGGCASPAGPTVLKVPADSYARAFDAAAEATREHGMPALLRDRRRGVIETEARIAGSVLEPWRTDNASLDQALENTIAFQRRRVRAEFTPAEFAPRDEPAISQSNEPNVVGSPPMDLTRHDGDLELRVWVYLERAYTPGIRRSTWSRSLTTRTVLTSPEREQGAATGQFWTTVTRDINYERRILAAVQSDLASADR